MRMYARGLLVAGLVVGAGATAFGLGFGGSFDDIAGLISGEVAGGDPSAVKIQKFIEKDSDRLSKDFITFSKVAKEAEKNGYAVISLDNLTIEFNDMVSRSGDFGAAAVARLADVLASEPDPRKVARLYKKQLLYIAKQAKFITKYEDALAGGDLAKAAVYYAAVQKLFEAIDRAFPAV